MKSEIFEDDLISALSDSESALGKHQVIFDGL